MQESKFKEAIRYYDPIVKKKSEAILDVPAIVLANLCASMRRSTHESRYLETIFNARTSILYRWLKKTGVSYIMTSQNEEAEELMRKIEKEEERLAYTEPDRQQA